MNTNEILICIISLLIVLIIFSVWIKFDLKLNRAEKDIKQLMGELSALKAELRELDKIK